MLEVNDADCELSLQGILITRSSLGATRQEATEVPEAEVQVEQSTPSGGETSKKAEAGDSKVSSVQQDVGPMKTSSAAKGAEKSTILAGEIFKLIGEPQATVPRSSL